MQQNIEKLKEQFKSEIKAIKDDKNFETIKYSYLGKKGVIVSLYNQLKTVANTEKAILGKSINELRNFFEQQLAEKEENLQKSALNNQIEKEWVDFSLDLKQDVGALHPISKMQYDLEDIFESMGFIVLDGPHIETDFYNFESLNIPKDHPSRDLQDTFFFGDNYLLRTQTSPLQIKAMEKLEPPIKAIAPGKVFRAENRDAAHENCFHQLEGIVVTENTTVAHLIYFMEVILAEIFDSSIKVRIRPGYFPFVEPGFELDMSCQICSGRGCSMCKKTGWVEMMGCGMVHPSVLKAGKLDPKKYTGFAFGVGLDRLCIMKHKVNDIRYFHSGDLRFFKQFS